MPIDFVHVVLIMMVLFGASVIQSAVGFAFGLFAIPILVWLGADLQWSIAICVACMVPQTSYGLWRYRQHIKWREVLIYSAIRLPAVLLGFVVLVRVVTMDKQYIKAVLGAVLLLSVIAREGSRRWKRQTGPRTRSDRRAKPLHRGWMWLSAGLAGFIGGSVGMGGPPMVLWLQAQPWTSKQVRVFIWMAVLILLPAYFIIMPSKWMFGPTIYRPMLIGLLAAPVVVAGSMAGMIVGRRLPKRRLDHAMTLILALIAISSLVSPFIASPQTDDADTVHDVAPAAAAHNATPATAAAAAAPAATAPADSPVADPQSAATGDGAAM